MTRHQMDPTRVHHEWDPQAEPALIIESGDVVKFELPMAGHGQIVRGRPIEKTNIDFATTYHLQGPVYVASARPGQTLAVEIIELLPGEWGWSGVLPGLGLLPEFQDAPFLRYFDLQDGVAHVAPHVQVPLRPFLGVLSTLPRDLHTTSPFPPHAGGGNIDTRHLTVGSTLLLPVFRDGAVFSCGDPHAAQGDGEVCVNALETSMTATLKFSIAEYTIPTPQFSAPAETRSDAVEPSGYWGTMGISPDLMEGAQVATRSMIDLLHRELGLAAQDAYLLCSLAGDLRIFEIVDAGVFNVGMTLSKSVRVAACESPRDLWRLPIRERVESWQHRGSIHTSFVSARSGW